MKLSSLNKYKENNRIEAKEATGGLPRSIWETYSAFANTSGGVILLGVAENKEDKTLYPVDLPDAWRLIAQFWELLQDTRIVNRNVIPKKNIAVEKVEGKEIVVIRVPRAKRIEKPVYIGGDPYKGSYYRMGDGDFRFTEEEVRKMLNSAKKE